jgi:hypothetical protein
MRETISKPFHRYDVEQECEGAEACLKGKWFASLWGSCSKSCDGGTRKRKVI